MFWMKLKLEVGMCPQHHLSKSDQGSDREPPGMRPREGAEEKLAPGPPDPEDPDDPEGGDSDVPSRRNIPELEGNLLFQHESRGHWLYDCGCDACVQARGRTPARRCRKKNDGDQRSAIQLAADYTYIAGRHWRLLILLMLHTQMMGIVVMTGDRDNDIKSVASVLNEIGVGGLNIEVAKENVILWTWYQEDLPSQTQGPIIGGTFRSIDLRLRVLNEQYA